MTRTIKTVDSHTGGEPTRIIIEGGPDLGNRSMAERLELFRDQFDGFRSAVVNEPRGSDVMVGGLLCVPTDPKFSAGVIFFNNAGFLGMCGHGMIGLMVTLKHMGKINDGSHQIETPVGDVRVELSGSEVSVENVPSYRLHANVTVEVPGYGTVVGDIAWGGNWFFLVKNSPEKLVVENTDHLTHVALQIRTALVNQSITEPDGAMIDHIELFGPPADSRNDSRNFVLCPGGAYDRSPCGTGTSAKLACLASDGIRAPGERWRQESIVGSVFICSYREDDSPAHEGNIKKIIPTIQGSAFLCSESTLILDPDDPFCMGIPT